MGETGKRELTDRSRDVLQMIPRRWTNTWEIITEAAEMLDRPRGSVSQSLRALERGMFVERRCVRDSKGLAMGCEIRRLT